MWVGIGVGIGRNRFATGIFNAYALRVTADGGITEAGQCVDAVTGLLLNASLLLIPSGYKGGKLYSQIPTNGNGDLTWTRGSDAFRTNASGLIQRVPWNLLSQSEAFETASWTKVRSTITANSTTAPNGTTTADTMTCNDTGTSGCWATQTTTITSERTCSIYVKANTGFYFQIHRDFGVGVVFNLSNGTVKQSVSATGTIENVGNGWYKCTATFSGSGQTLFLLGNASMTVTSWASTNNESAFIWGAQLVEGTTAQTYLPTTDRLNFPRLSYMYGSCPSVLAEPQRTNLVLQSNTFNTTWAMFAGPAVTPNTTTSPDGSTNATTLNSSGGTNDFLFQTLSGLTVGATYTFSFYIKNLNSTASRSWGPSASTSIADFSWSGSTLVSISGSGNSFTSVGNGWYRVVLTGAAATATPSMRIYADVINTSKSVYIYGAQLEAGAYPTTYIPTTTATATRVADSFSRNNIYTNGLISASGGTWFVELRGNLSYNSSNGAIQLGLGNNTSGATADNIWIAPSASGRMRIWKQVAGTLTTLFTTSTDTAKIAIKWNGTTADVFVNGTKQVSATSFTPTALESLRTIVVEQPYFIQQMALFPTPLSDTDCATLTT